MSIEQLEEISIETATLPEYSVSRESEGCNDCCCDLGCETYD